ncbi:ligase, partial [Vibrio alginolyticus]|nr:ligase [Vibrio alginolyticus]MDW1934365.1 ligase [Vibrio sp. 970]
IMVFFVAVNTTIILILLLPVMISRKRTPEPQTVIHSLPVNKSHEF